MECSNCQAFEPQGSNWGVCVLVPPSKTGNDWEQPVVSITDRCLKFIHKDGIEATKRAHIANNNGGTPPPPPPAPSAAPRASKSKTNTRGKK